MNINFSSAPSDKTDSIVVGVFKDGKFSKSAEAYDKNSDGALRAAMEASYFKGEEGQTLGVSGMKGLTAKRVVLLGLGDEKELNETNLTAVGGKLASYLRATPDQTCDVILDDLKAKDTTSEQAAAY